MTEKSFMTNIWVPKVGIKILFQVEVEPVVEEGEEEEVTCLLKGIVLRGHQ